jgi:hypothetical protein
MPATLQAVEEQLYAALTEVAAGAMEPAIGNSMATIARALAAIHEQAELEPRLIELERRAGLKTG